MSNQTHLHRRTFLKGLGAAVCLCKAWRDMRAAAWKP